jgi:2-C-methyl-D-erythritol 4-phosphate cytidylyltransferase
MQSINKYAIIVAGGSGSRMKTEIPKQFLELLGKPIIVHTIEKFLQANCSVIVVLPIQEFKRWDEIKLRFPLLNNVIITSGGSTRFESVKNGLNQINKEGIVLIHDAVRPMISINKINELIDFTIKNGNVSAAMPCVDTIRFEKENKSFEIIDRNKIWMMQTPQCFKTNDLKDAYQKAKHTNYTDDAAVYEDAGYKLNLLEGEKTNIKITVIDDLKLAEYYLTKV